MDAEEVSSFIEELREFLGSKAGPGADGAVDPELLNDLADYIEGVDPSESSLDRLRQALQSACSQEETLEERMRIAGSRRSLQLLRVAFQRA
jgi:hypothetical protein